MTTTEHTTQGDPLFTVHTLSGTRTAINPDHVVSLIEVEANGGNPPGTIIQLSNGVTVNAGAEFETIVNAVAQGRTR